MKKLVIFLILFIFTMPAFAQGESSFTENFSLIKDPGDNNRGFLNLNILFCANYLFFAENKRHSRQHQAFQIFRFHQVSNRASLSRIATVENKKQKWGDIYNFMYGKQQDISSEKKSESLAEGYLKRLAERSKRSRKIWGTILLIGGGAYLVYGVDLLSSADEDDALGGLFAGVFGTLAVATGAVMAGGGLYNLSIPSRAERKLDDVLSISDPGHRERASHVALSSLAARGRRGRILGGIIWAGFSALALFSDEGSFLLAAEYGALAAYNLIRKSRAERTFQRYLKEKEFQNRLEFRLGIMPHGGVKIGFMYSF